MSYTKGNWKFEMSKENDKVKIFVGDRDDSTNDEDIIGGCGCCGSPYTNNGKFDVPLMAASNKLFELLKDIATCTNNNQQIDQNIIDEANRLINALESEPINVVIGNNNLQFDIMFKQSIHDEENVKGFCDLKIIIAGSEYEFLHCYSYNILNFLLKNWEYISKVDPYPYPIASVYDTNIKSKKVLRPWNFGSRTYSEKCDSFLQKHNMTKIFSAHDNVFLINEGDQFWVTVDDRSTFPECRLSSIEALSILVDLGNVIVKTISPYLVRYKDDEVEKTVETWKKISEEK